MTELIDVKHLDMAIQNFEPMFRAAKDDLLMQLIRSGNPIYYSLEIAEEEQREYIDKLALLLKQYYPAEMLNLVIKKETTNSFVVNKMIKAIQAIL